MWRTKAENYKIELQRVKMTSQKQMEELGGGGGGGGGGIEEEETYIKTSEYEDRTLSRSHGDMNTSSVSEGRLSRASDTTTRQSRIPSKGATQQQQQQQQQQQIDEHFDEYSLDKGRHNNTALNTSTNSTTTTTTAKKSKIPVRPSTSSKSKKSLNTSSSGGVDGLNNSLTETSLVEDRLKGSGESAADRQVRLIYSSWRILSK